MIAKDMKYTALYWALHFEETSLDVYCKQYNGYELRIDAEKQTVDYGKDIVVIGEACRCLKRHKDFVILECINRLLLQGYQPAEIVVDGREGCADILLAGGEIICEEWGEDYENRISSLSENGVMQVVYTSRLVSGLMEYKKYLFFQGSGVDEKALSLPIRWKLYSEMNSLEEGKYLTIHKNELVSYMGHEKKVVVPEGIISIAASAFWNNTFVEEVVLPSTLKQIGGDCFYYCKNLRKANIPRRVEAMGNNPFAGCPFLELTNESPKFVLQNGVLYNEDKTVLIHYTMKKSETKFVIPDGVKIVGKHSFFACNNLKKITVPQSVIHFENNPFSGCEELEVENHSPSYIFDNGVIYDKYETMVIGCLNGTTAERLFLRPSIKAINRNSFWNCKGIKELVIPKNVVRIGYNPFAGAGNMLLGGNPQNYVIENGIIYTANGARICCATDRAVGEEFLLPDTVKTINRGVFSGCRSLKKIDLNQVTYIGKSAFTNCVGLEELYIPDGVTYIGEWVFAYCANLKRVSIKKGTVVDRNAFNECPAKIEWRD